MNRHTDVGKRIEMIQDDDFTEPGIDMLRKIIYCGQPKLNKFIISDFHEGLKTP